MNSSRGFTLIEVMVAMLLLLSAIALTSVVYSNAVNSTLKAERSLMISQYLPAILEQTRRQIRSTRGLNREGEGSIRGVSFHWEITELRKGAPPPQFDVETREYRRYGDKFTLWNVSLIIRHKNLEQEVNFKEVTW